MSGEPNALFALGAIALFFLLPGYLLVKALWPEKRWRGPTGGPVVAIEMLTGGFVASLGIFLLVGFVLGNTGSFAAGASDPTLEVLLAAFALLFFVLGWMRGAYRKDPPPAPSYAEGPAAGEEPLGEQLERFQRWSVEERRLERELRAARREGPGGVREAERLKQELMALREQRRAAERERQSEIAG